MTDDQFTQLFKTIQEVKADMATKDDIARVTSQVESVYGLLDANIREHERQEQERAAMAHQLDRHDRWMHQLADKSGVTLTS